MTTERSQNFVKITHTCLCNPAKKHTEW